MTINRFLEHDQKRISLDNNNHDDDQKRKHDLFLNRIICPLKGLFRALRVFALQQINIVVEIFGFSSPSINDPLPPVPAAALAALALALDPCPERIVHVLIRVRGWCAFRCDVHR